MHDCGERRLRIGEQRRRKMGHSRPTHFKNLKVTQNYFLKIGGVTAKLVKEAIDEDKNIEYELDDDGNVVSVIYNVDNVLGKILKRYTKPEEVAIASFFADGFAHNIIEQLIEENSEGDK
jgi:hypothetical protein